MLATMARQGGRLQQEQSNVHPAWNMAKIAKCRLQRAAMEPQVLISKPHAEVQEETMRGVAFPGHNRVEAVIERNLAMLRQQHTARCLPCEKCTARNLQTRWRRKGTGAPPPKRRSQPTPEPTPPLPSVPPRPNW